MSTIQVIHQHEVQLCYEGGKKRYLALFFFFPAASQKKSNQPELCALGLPVPQSTELGMCDDDDAKLLLSTAHCDTLCLCLVPAPSHFTETIVIVFCCIVLMTRVLPSSRSLCVSENNSPRGLFLFFLFGIGGMGRNELAR